MQRVEEGSLRHGYGLELSHYISKSGFCSELAHATSRPLTISLTASPRVYVAASLHQRLLRTQQPLCLPAPISFTYFLNYHCFSIKHC